MNQKSIFPVIYSEEKKKQIILEWSTYICRKDKLYNCLCCCISTNLNIMSKLSPRKDWVLGVNILALYLQCYKKCHCHAANYIK